MTLWGPMWRHSNKETRPTNVGYVALFDTLHCSMLRGRVHGVSLSCGARVGRVFGHVGGASAGVRESGCTLLGKRNGASVGRNGREGAGGLYVCAPSPRVYPRARGCLLVG